MDNVFSNNPDQGKQESTDPKDQQGSTEEQDPQRTGSLFDSLPEEVKDFVGEGRKYKSAEEALKSIPHAQSHISQLEEELKQLKEDLDKRLTAEEALKEIQERAGKRDHDQQSESSFDPDTLKNLAKEAYQELTTEEKYNRNLQTASDKMVEQYGDMNKARQALEGKAKELDVSIEWLMDTAQKSPQSFFKLVGLEAKQGPAVNTSRGNSSTNTESFESSSVKPYSYKWYQKMRRDNPREYYNSRTQMEMHRKAKELGDDFYK